MFNQYLNNEIDDQIVTLDPVPSTENTSSPLVCQSSASPVPPFISSPGIQEFLREQFNQLLQELVVTNLINTTSAAVPNTVPPIHNGARAANGLPDLPLDTFPPLQHRFMSAPLPP